MCVQSYTAIEVDTIIACVMYVCLEFNGLDDDCYHLLSMKII